MPRRNNPAQNVAKPLSQACLKRRYQTKQDALVTAQHQMALDPQLELRVYQCPRCGMWHLTRLHKT